MKLADVRVLFAPAHYFTGADVGGSEFGWPYQLIAQLAPQIRGADVVVGELRNGTFPANVHVRQVLPVARQHLFSTGTALRFTLAYWTAALAATRKTRFDLLHHVLPYSPITVNPLIVLKGTWFGIGSGTRIVVGPLQMPHEEPASPDDEDTGALYRRDFTASPPSVGRPVARRRRRLVGGSLARRLSRDCLNRADAVVAITNETKDYLVDLGIRSRIEVIPTGVDTSSFSAVDRTDRSGPFHLFLPTYFLKRKAIDLLIHALARARNRCDVDLLLLGDGPQRASIAGLIDQLGLHSAVRMPGFVNHAAIRDHFATADAYVSMSWSESLPVAIMEAMSTSLPCISTANAGARALIEDGRTGILTPPGNVDAFAAAIVQLASDRQYSQRLGAAARAAMETRYDWNQIGAQYAALYQSVLEDKSS